MKKFINKVLVVLAMTSAITANVNAKTSPKDVKSTVAAIVDYLHAPTRTTAGNAMQRKNLEKLAQYADEYPAIGNYAGNLAGETDQSIAKRQASAKSGKAYEAQQNINAIMDSVDEASSRGSTKSTHIPPKSKKIQTSLNQETQKVEAATKELDKAKRTADRARTDQKITEAQKIVDEKINFVQREITKLKGIIDQLDSNILDLIANRNKLIEQQRLATDNEEINKIQKEIDRADAQIREEEKAQGIRGLAAAASSYISANKKALMALGVGVAGTAAAGYAAYRSGYIPSREDISSAAGSMYNRLPSYETIKGYMPSATYLGYGAGTTAGLAGAAYATKKYRAGEKAVTPADLDKAATELKTAETKLDNAQATADKLPTQANMDKVEDLKQEVNIRSIDAINKLEGLRNWNGDLRGYTQQEVDHATENLITLRAQESTLKEQLKEVTDEGFIYNRPKADKKTEYHDIATSLDNIRQQIKHNEIIAGTRRSNAIRGITAAIIGAAVLGAAVALDYQYNEGNLMKSAADYGSAALATGTGYARSGMETARGYASSAASGVRSGASKLYENAPDVKGRLSRAYQSLPSRPTWLGSTTATTPQVVPTSTGETFSQMAAKKIQEAAVGMTATEALHRAASRGYKYVNPEEGGLE